MIITVVLILLIRLNILILSSISQAEYLKNLALEVEEIDRWAEDSSANPRTPPCQRHHNNIAASIDTAQSTAHLPNTIAIDSLLTVSLLLSLRDEPNTQSPSSTFGLGPFTHLYNFGIPGVDNPPTNYRVYIPTDWVYKPSQTEVNCVMSLLDPLSDGPGHLRIQKGKYYFYYAHFTLEKYRTLNWLQFFGNGTMLSFKSCAMAIP